MSSQESRFKLQSFNEILNLPDPEFLIEGMLVKDAFAVIFGPSGVGKTFLGLSIAFAVATRTSWNGKAVNGGPVVYVSAEGRAGLKDRSRALQQHNEWSDEPPFSFVTEPVNFLDQAQIIELINEIKKIAHEPALIIVDTLARCFVGGNENDARDMGLFIFGIDILRRATGAAILVVHHTGKNEKSGERGSSALRGAADTMIKCGGEMDLVFVQCDKQKDAEPFKDIQLQFRKVQLDDGRSSCVLVPFEGFVSGNESAAKKRNIKTLVEALERLGPEGASHGKWKESCVEVGMSESKFARGLRDALKEELVVKEGDGQGARYRVDKSEAVSVSPGVKAVS
jgi:hypothetical protein